MANNPTTFEGNLSHDLKAEDLKPGAKTPYLDFQMIVDNGKVFGTEEKKDPLVLQIRAFGGNAENLLSSAQKGTALIVTGRLESFTTNAVVDGVERSILRHSIKANKVAIDLTFASAVVTRTSGRGINNGGQAPQQGAPAQQYAQAPVQQGAPVQQQQQFAPAPAQQQQFAPAPQQQQFAPAPQQQFAPAPVQQGAPAPAATDGGWNF